MNDFMEHGSRSAPSHAPGAAANTVRDPAARDLWEVEAAPDSAAQADTPISGAGAEVRVGPLPGHVAGRRFPWRWIALSILLALVGLASGLVIAPLAYSTPAGPTPAAASACATATAQRPYGCGYGSPPNDQFVPVPAWKPHGAYWSGQVVLTNLDAHRAFQGFVRLIGADGIQCVNAPFGLSTWQVNVPRGGQITLTCAVTNPPFPGGIAAHVFGGAWASRWPSAADAVLVQIDNPTPFTWIPGPGAD